MLTTNKWLGNNGVRLPSLITRKTKTDLTVTAGQ